MTIVFSVPGDPKGKARPKVTRTKAGTSLTYTPDKTVAYEELVRLRFSEAAAGRRFEAGKPLRLRIAAFFGVPASKPKKTKILMLQNLIRPTKKPDFDNVFKIVCDALNGIAYADDAQIVEAQITKVFTGGDPHIEVELQEIGVGEA